MTSRERVSLALNHTQPDRIPLDLGGAPTTGMHVSTIYKLRQELRLDKPGTPVKVHEPYQMLGEIKPDLMEALGVDVIGIMPRGSLLGVVMEGEKEWEMFDGTPVIVPEGFNTEYNEHGEILSWPDGDRSLAPSAKMPDKGYFFDAIIRQAPIDEAKLDPQDNLEEFQAVSDADLRYFIETVNRLHAGTDKAIVVNFGNTAFGDVALVPAPWLRHPKGIRDIEEWYVSTAMRPDYIKAVFEGQCRIALENLEKFYAAIGDKITAVYMSGTDFGTQNAPFMGLSTYEDLYQPYQKRLNDWIHRNTPWKTFMHSCGSIMPLIPGIVKAGFDILNPVQTSAANMDPVELKEKFGKDLTFWGGGVDTQKTLPFGTPDEVRAQVKQNLDVFGKDGGYVFNPIHNVQAETPVENLLAMYETVKAYKE